MALNFSANQFEGAFISDRIQHWELPHKYREADIIMHPRRYEGFTQIVADPRGRLLPGVKRSRACPWGPFVGTWNLPRRLPAVPMVVKTARTQAASDELQRLKKHGDNIIFGRHKYTRLPEDKGLKLPENHGGQKMLNQHALEPINDLGFHEPSDPASIMDQCKSPAHLYQYPSIPEVRKPSPQETKQAMEDMDRESLNTNNNAIWHGACDEKPASNSVKVEGLVTTQNPKRSCQSACKVSNFSRDKILSPPSDPLMSSSLHEEIQRSGLLRMPDTF